MNKKSDDVPCEVAERFCNLLQNCVENGRNFCFKVKTYEIFVVDVSFEYLSGSILVAVPGYGCCKWNLKKPLSSLDLLQCGVPSFVGIHLEKIFMVYWKKQQTKKEQGNEEGYQEDCGKDNGIETGKSGEPNGGIPPAPQ